MKVARTAEQAARATDDDIFVCRQASGILSFNQDGHATVMQAGELSLLDPLMPYEAEFAGQSQTLVLKIPRRSLEARLGPIRSLVGMSFGTATQYQRWISLFLASLPGIADQVTRQDETMLQTQAIDLIASALTGTKAAAGARVSSTRSGSLFKLRAAIEARLSDPSLNSARICRDVGISNRYANALLAAEGDSIMSLVLRRRLDRCVIALEDRRQDHLTISEIAHGWGFSDMTHFSRSFKTKFGIRPSECRKISKQRQTKP